MGAAKIDPDSVKVLFLRTPNVDLTARVKPFVKAEGINMQDAEFNRVLNEFEKLIATLDGISHAEKPSKTIH